MWCIGLNSKTHADDISAVQPEDPGSFMKPASCMFQPDGVILLLHPRFQTTLTRRANWYRHRTKLPLRAAG